LRLSPGRADVEARDDLARQLAVVIDERVPVVSVGLGDPAPIAAAAKAAGSLVMAMVTTVDEAKRVVAGGADVVMAQGAEAGGHRSTFPLGPDDAPALVGTMALVPQVRDAVTVPVVAAGGIGDGRGLAAALALGAEGVALGTRFLVARESTIFRAWQERLLSATEADTLVTRVFTGRPARVIANELARELARRGLRPLGWGLQSAAADDLYAHAKAHDDAEHAPLYAGQALRLLRRGQGAGEIVAELVREAEATLARVRGVIE
jgi:nitronate monooxygenase